MKKHLRLLAIICLSTCQIIHAQKYANTWYFGNKAGLDFNDGASVAITNSAMDQLEGCSSISDDNGNILFYTNGYTVWNKNHVPMANGTGLEGDETTTQSACIVKKPGARIQCTIFSLQVQKTMLQDFNIILLI
ncbi:MAG: hypothetical protein IPO27_16230 [Bacteroidetes bacterium]|nr:hypothetical protein [Bacteroidota bacterium]